MLTVRGSIRMSCTTRLRGATLDDWCVAADQDVREPVELTPRLVSPSIAGSALREAKLGMTEGVSKS